MCSVFYYNVQIELKFSINGDQQHWIIGKQFANKKEATLKSFGVKSKGAEVHLFLSKGVGADGSSVDDDGANTVNSRDQEWHQQQNRYQQSTQQYQSQQSTQQYQSQQSTQQYQSQQSTQQYQSQQSTQRYQSQQYNQPPPDQQYYQHQNQHNQQGHQQQQEQYYSHHQTSQSQQEQQFSRQSNVPYNQYDNNRLPHPGPTQHQHYNNPSPGQFRNFQPLTYMPEAVAKQPDKPVRPPTPPKIGWACPRCTVVNEPYRPGCEVCGENRPDDYKPPPGYTPTKDEERWLQDEVKERLHFEEVCID